MYDKVDVRQTVGDFKKKLEKFVGQPAAKFKLFYIDTEARKLMAHFSTEELKLPNRILHSFNVRDGDEFEIDLKPPATTIVSGHSTSEHQLQHVYNNNSSNLHFHHYNSHFNNNSHHLFNPSSFANTSISSSPNAKTTSANRIGSKSSGSFSKSSTAFSKSNVSSSEVTSTKRTRSSLSFSKSRSVKPAALKSDAKTISPNQSRGGEEAAKELSCSSLPANMSHLAHFGELKEQEESSEAMESSVEFTLDASSQEDKCWGFNYWLLKNLYFFSTEKFSIYSGEWKF